MKRRTRFGFIGMAILAMLFTAVLQPGVSSAGVNDVMLGARYGDDAASTAIGLSPWQDGAINTDNFATFFTTNKLTISGNNSGVMIGAIMDRDRVMRPAEPSVVPAPDSDRDRYKQQFGL